jgi:hypothetical protein
VYAVIMELFEQGKRCVRPGDVNSVLRAKGSPLGTWEVRAEFSRLEADNLLQWQASNNVWVLPDQATLSGEAACGS